MNYYFSSQSIQLYQNSKQLKQFPNISQKQIISICRDEGPTETNFYIITYKTIYSISSSLQSIDIFYNNDIEPLQFRAYKELCSIIYKSSLCLIGGSQSLESKRDFQRIDLETSKYSPSESMNTARSRPSACVSNELLYVAGGWSLSYIDSIEKFNGEFWLTLEFRLPSFKSLSIFTYSQSRLLILNQESVQEPVYELNLNHKLSSPVKSLSIAKDIQAHNVVVTRNSISYLSKSYFIEEPLAVEHFAEREIFLILREILQIKLV